MGQTVSPNTAIKYTCLADFLEIQPLAVGAVAYPGFFFGGVSTNSVEDRENGDLGVVAP